MAESTVSEQTQNDRPTFAFEQVACRLEPFDLMKLAFNTGGNDQRSDVGQLIQRARMRGASDVGQMMRGISQVANEQRQTDKNHALFPIFLTNGLVFPYNPTISEGVSVKYDAVELTHANESFHVYRATDNVRINISNAVWTCDTFDNAVYAMAALHFFRTYSQMDFGAGRSGRPPSPMWFSAYGNYAFHRVPVLLEKADWTFPNDVDYVGIPEFGSAEYADRKLRFERDESIPYTWIPMKFEISSISLVVQHSPRFWTTWNLDDFRSGRMVQQGRKSFHAVPPIKPRNSTNASGLGDGLFT